MNAPDVKEKRKAWGETITKYLPEKLVFLDESGVNTDMTRIYGRTMGGERPVICMDEKPVKIFASARKSLRSKDGRTTYEDNEYIRNGTASIFLFTEPLNGWRYADAQEHRTREDWAKQIEWLLTEQYPDAEKVILVMDNLNTHSIASLYQTFAPEKAFNLASRFEIHYTPRHGSWLDIAEIELSAPLLHHQTSKRVLICCHILRLFLLNTRKIHQDTLLKD